MTYLHTPNRDLLTTNQAAEYLNVPAPTLTTWRSTGRNNLPYVKIGRHVRYRKSDLDTFLKQQTRTHTGQAAAAFA